MFCKNCGGQMNDNQAICLKCGVETGKGNAFCANCGQPVAPNAAVCLSCGVAIQPAKANVAHKLNGKDKVVVALLCFFFGGIGIHNFYMGESKRGIFRIVMTLLCGLGGIFALVDLIKILMDSYQYDPNKLV